MLQDLVNRRVASAADTLVNAAGWSLVDYIPHSARKAAEMLQWLEKRFPAEFRMAKTRLYSTSDKNYVVGHKTDSIEIWD